MGKFVFNPFTGKLDWTEVASGVQSIIAGTNVTVDNTDPQNPIVSSTGGGGGSTAYYQYIYNSSSPTQLGNVFNNWSDMIAAIDGREAIVQFQQNEVLPVGNWNIDYHIWRGNGLNPDSGGLIIEFPEGCYIDSAINWVAENGLSLYSTSVTHPTYTQTVAHGYVFDRAAIYTDNIEFIKIQASGLLSIVCQNGYGLFNDGAGMGSYEVFNIDSFDYGTIIVTVKNGSSPTIQNNTIRSNTNIVYGWLTQSSEALSGNATQANLSPGSINFSGEPLGDGGLLFSNAKVIGFIEGQPNGISSNNVSDALAELHVRKIGSDLTVNDNDFTLNADSATHQVYTGSGNDCSLPLIADTQVGKMFMFKNRGSGNLNISPSGSDQTYDIAPNTTVVLAPGDAIVSVNDGEYWDIE